MEATTPLLPFATPVAIKVASCCVRLRGCHIRSICKRLGVIIKRFPWPVCTTSHSAADDEKDYIDRPSVPIQITDNAPSSPPFTILFSSFYCLPFPVPSKSSGGCCLPLFDHLSRLPSDELYFQLLLAARPSIYPATPPPLPTPSIYPRPATSHYDAVMLVMFVIQVGGCSVLVWGRSS